MSGRDQSIVLKVAFLPTQKRAGILAERMAFLA
jgi:hypothetical protein